MTRKFILDTDWFTDCDDCVALRLLIRRLSADKQLLGINVNAPTEFAYASISAFLKNEGLDVPVSLDEENLFPGEALYQKRMASQASVTNSDATRSIDLYRQLLEDNDQVEILSIGFMNSLQAVFEQLPKLAENKIKRIWAMGGKWDEQGGKEYNFSASKLAVQSSQFVINHTSCEIVLLGFEVGANVITGRRLAHNDVLFHALSDFGTPDGRNSWDPMLILAGTADNPHDLFNFVRGTATIDNDGRNYFEQSSCGMHCYLTKKHPDEFYESEIERFL